MKTKLKITNCCNLIVKLLIVSCFISATVGLDDYFNAEYFDEFNPSPRDFNTKSSQVGFDSGGNDNPNALQFSGGASVSEAPMYDNYGNQLVVDGIPVVTEADRVGYYGGYHNGKIHAGAIASITIDGTARNCIYLNAADIQGSGTFSGWVRVDKMSPSSTIWQYSQEINERRENVRYTTNSGGNSRYEKMEVTDQEVPSSLQGGYIIPNRRSNAGKVDYYYLRDGLINGFINLPETGNKRHGVQCSRVAPGASFWRDKDVDNYIQNIYGYDSSSVIGTFRWCYGYFITNAGTKIYCWTNRECLRSIDDTSTSFVPNPNKKYYIDAPIHNVRLAATGESDDVVTISTTTTGEDVEWKFVDSGNGYWHIQLASGGSKPRLRSDSSEKADMQSLSSDGTRTYFEITKGAIEGSYFLTLPEATIDHVRLQIDNTGAVNMVEEDRNGTWESFKITEAGTTVIANDVRLEAEDFDSMSGIQTEESTESNENVGYIHNNDWLRFDDVNLSGLSNMDARIACNFSGGTIEVRTGSTSGALIGSISISNTGGNQNWVTLNTSISNISGIRDVYLVFKGGSGYLFNVNWIAFNTSSTANKDAITSAEASNVVIYPKPVIDILNIDLKNMEHTNAVILDINGKIVFSKNISKGSNTINLEQLSAGLYVVKIISKEKTHIKKIIKK